MRKTPRQRWSLRMLRLIQIKPIGRLLWSLRMSIAAAGVLLTISAGAWAQTISDTETHASPAMSVPISPYVVSDLSIDVRAENAVKAREKAFSEALMKGFLVMLERLVPDTAMREKIRTPQSAELGKMLQDFTTHNEQLSPTRYTALYELRFKPRAVDMFLANPTAMQSLPNQGAAVPVEAGVGRSDGAVASSSVSDLTSTGTSLILPFYQGAANPSLWTGVNPLRDALAAANLSATIFRAPLGDLEDMQALDETHALNFTSSELQAMLARYEASQAIIALAIPDGRTSGEAVVERGPAQEGVTVLLYAATPTHPKPRYLHTLSIALTGGGDDATLYAQVVEKMRSDLPDVLADAEKNQRQDTVSTLVSSGAPSTSPVAVPPSMATTSDNIAGQGQQSLQILARFNTMNDWQEIRTRLSTIQSIHAVRILSLKTREARAELVYIGALESLKTALTAAGIQFSPAQMTFDSAAVAVPGSDLLMTETTTSQSSSSIFEVTLSPWGAGGEPAPSSAK